MMVKQQLTELLSKQFKINVDNINNGTHLLNDLHADSLDLMEAVMLVEDQFKISISEHEYQTALTVDSIVNLVNLKLAEKQL